MYFYSLSADLPIEFEWLLLDYPPTQECDRPLYKKPSVLSQLSSVSQHDKSVIIDTFRSLNPIVIPFPY